MIFKVVIVQKHNIISYYENTECHNVIMKVTYRQTTHEKETIYD